MVIKNNLQRLIISVSRSRALNCKDSCLLFNVCLSPSRRTLVYFDLVLNLRNIRSVPRPWLYKSVSHKIPLPYSALSL